MLLEGGDVAYFVNNSMNVLNEYAVEVFNVKKATFEGNYFGVTVKSPVFNEDSYLFIWEQAVYPVKFINEFDFASSRTNVVMKSVPV